MEKHGSNNSDKDISLVKIKNCGLSTRAKNCLIRIGLVNLQELSRYTKKQVSKFYNLGVKSQLEIENIMIQHGIWYKEE